jgi:PPK2 family polyphosphate:nucleotide phosphotransferase
VDYNEEFRIHPGSDVKLKKIDPSFTGKFKDKEDAEEQIKKNLKRIAELQELLYAEHKQSVLIVLQGMDTSGKDGTIKSIGGAMNPQGCRVACFKAPSKDELAHDFLWRVHSQTPAKGEVTIFNRSHYEDVVAVRVEKLAPKEVWEKRYDIINNFESALTENGTHVLKFFLHIDEEEQLKRLMERIADDEKQWKLSTSDFTAREKWDEYQKAWEDALRECSTKKAPWYVIPANHKWFRNLAISQITVDYLEALNMQLPKPQVDIEALKKKYLKGAKKGLKDQFSPK